MEQTIPFADQLFLTHLLKTSPANYYAAKKDMRYSKMRNLRIAMNVCSVLLLLVSLVYSGYSLMGALLYKQQSEDSRIKADFYQTRYNMAKERLPKTPVDSYMIKTAVDAANTLNEYKATPYEMLSIVGRSLQRFPEIELDDMNWVFSITSEVHSNDNGNPSQFVTPAVGTNTEQEYKYYQISNINAHISPFDGNYREAIAIVNKFAEALRENQQVHSVSITSFPLDISSTATLQGNTELTEKEALFSLKTVVGIN